MIWFLVVGDNRRASISGKTAPASNSNLNWCKGYVAGLKKKIFFFCFGLS
jgi:hypothetical protein